MSTFVWGSSITYSDYLQAKSLLGDVTAEVSAQSRSLIASHKHLERAGITLRETVKNEAGAQIEVFRYASNQTTEAIRELNATFRWESAQLLAVAGRMADSLKELLRISKTPAQNWAYERYEIARDLVRRNLYPGVRIYSTRD